MLEHLERAGSATSPESTFRWCDAPEAGHLLSLAMSTPFLFWTYYNLQKTLARLWRPMARGGAGFVPRGLMSNHRSRVRHNDQWMRSVYGIGRANENDQAQ